MKRLPAHPCAFSLVEVVLALGIISLALVSIMGMTMVGLKGFRQAINTTIEAQIAQKLANELQQSSYTNLIVSGSTNYYFNYEGVPTNAAEAAFTVTMAAPTNVALPDASSHSTNLLAVTFHITRKNSSSSTNVFQVYVANAGF